MKPLRLTHEKPGHEADRKSCRAISPLPENKKGNQIQTASQIIEETKEERSKTPPANPKPKNGPLKIRRTVVQARSPKASAPARPNISEPVPQDLQAAFRTMERSDGLGQYAVPPDQNTVDQLNELGRYFRLYLANQTLQRDEFILTIGFDFGTSCSKIIVNAPYAGERSFALVVPDFFQMDGHPHLWKGILSLEKLSERLSLSQLRVLPTIRSQDDVDGSAAQSHVQI